ncbi:MAG: hypothetical protein JSU86_07025, partial [Phycisphaerales bacterium]
MPAGSTDYGQAPGKTLQLFGATVYVNGLQISGGPTGFGPLLVPVGSDSSAHLDLRGKGVNGRVRAYNNSADREVATISGDQTLTDKTLTTPKIGTIHDPTQNLAVLELAGVASAVNWLEVTSGATGVGPTLKPDGETNVDLVLSGKGTGRVKVISDGSGAAFEVSETNVWCHRDNQKCQLTTYTYSNTSTHYPLFGLYRSRGTQASKTVVSADDPVGAVDWYGYNADSDWTSAARVAAYANNTPSGTDRVAGRIEFETGTSAVAPVARATIEAAGDLLIESTNQLQLYD